MNIWLINHYAVPPKFYPLARTTNFAKYLMRYGHTVTIFSASMVHNSSINLITNKSLYRKDIVDGIHYVYIKTCFYNSNGIARIRNMFQFARRLPKVCCHFEKPDVIIASSATPPACMSGIKLAKKYACRGIAEISDLWPESFVAYGLVSKKNPLLNAMYTYEKRLYSKADAIIFTMEGGRDYIIEKGWDKEHGGPVDLEKIYHINNGIDLKMFDYNSKNVCYCDDDLDNHNVFKVVYTGSIRAANQVDKLVGVAKLLHDSHEDNVKILIWGTGDHIEQIKEMITKSKLGNIILKGAVPKNYIPSILTRSDLNIYLLADSLLFRYGLSLNKSFEYFASGKPVLASQNSGYSIIDRYHCGICLDKFTPEKMVDGIMHFVGMPKNEYMQYCINARRAAEEYDFEVLTQKLINIIENCART